MEEDEGRRPFPLPLSALVSVRGGDEAQSAKKKNESDGEDKEEGKEAMMELRVHFPHPWVTKRMRFATSATVGHVLRELALRHAHALPSPRLASSPTVTKARSLSQPQLILNDDDDDEEEEEGGGRGGHEGEDRGRGRKGSVEGSDSEGSSLGSAKGSSGRRRRRRRGEYGLFIPRWANERVSGWLDDEEATLAGLGLRSGDIVECRPRRYRFTLLLPQHHRHKDADSDDDADGIGRDKKDAHLSTTGSFAAAEAAPPCMLRVSAPATLSVGRLLPRLLQAVRANGKSVPKMEPSLSAVVGLLDRNAELLHMPLPHEKVMYLLAYSDPRSNDSSQPPSNKSVSEIHADQCNLYIWLPSKEGMLWKYGEKISRFGKRWQKRYFVLQKDKLFYYKSLEHKQRGEALSFVAIQRVRAIVGMPPFDSFSRKSSGSCFQIETVTGDVFQLIAENQQQQAEWTDQLMAWLELKMFFGPDKRSSVQLFRKLSAERDQRRQTRAGSIVGGKGPTVPSLPLKKSSSPPQRRKEQVVERETEPISDESKEADVVIGVEEPQHEEGAVEINLLLHDGSIQPLVVDPNVEIYDLVYAVAHEIGSVNAFQITSLDQDPARRVELLDHQKTLRQHRIPKTAMFVLKKTGIVDENIGENDIFDNHFLYVMLPEIEGYLLRSSGRVEVFSPRREWHKFFVNIKINKLFFYPNHDDLNPLGFLPLGTIESVGRAPYSSSTLTSSTSIQSQLSPRPWPLLDEEAKALHQCLIRIRFNLDSTQHMTIDLLASTPAEAEQWLNVLSNWRHFFALEDYADDQPAGFQPVGSQTPGIAPLNFIEAGPSFLAAREQRAKEEESRRKEEELRCQSEEKTSSGSQEAEAIQEREVPVTPRSRHRPRPMAVKLVPDAINGWRPATEDDDQAAHGPLGDSEKATLSRSQGPVPITQQPTSPRSPLASSMSETRIGGSPQRIGSNGGNGGGGSSGWLSPRRLVEAISFRGSTLSRKSESARNAD